MSDFFDPPAFGAPQLRQGSVDVSAGLSLQIRTYATNCSFVEYYRNHPGYYSLAGQVTLVSPPAALPVNWSSIPWGIATQGGNRIVGPPPPGTVAPTDPPDPDPYGLTAKGAAVASAQSALSDAQAALAGSHAALATTQANVIPLEEACAVTKQEVFKAQNINLPTVTRRSLAVPPTATAAGVAAAQDRLTAAIAADQVSATALEAGNQLVSTAITADDACENSVEGAFYTLAGAESNLSLATLESSFGALNGPYYSTYTPTTSGYLYDTDNFYQAPQYLITNTVITDRIVSANTCAGGLFRDNIIDPPCYFGIKYGESQTAGQYRWTLGIYAEDYWLLAAGVTWLVQWCETATIYPSVAAMTPEWPEIPGAHPGDPVVDPGYAATPYSTFGTGQPDVTYVQMTETLSLADAVEQPDGSWILSGEIHDCAAPDMGDSATPPATTRSTAITGAPTLPTLTSQVQTQGAERFRQGWCEWQTPAAQPQARRYLTMTADNGPGTPEGVSYSGGLRFAAPPTNYDPTCYPDYDSTGQPLPDPASQPIIYPDGVGYGSSFPLVIYDTRSVSAGGYVNLYPYPPQSYQPLETGLSPSTLDAVTDGATLLSATVRAMAAPPGLRWTLSEEQTPAGILADAQAIRDAAWPVPPAPTEDDPTPAAPPSPSMGFPGAINFASLDGDHAIAQKMRFKLTYSANDTRVVVTTYVPSAPGTPQVYTTSVDSFTVTFHWAYRRRDLLSGTVTMEPYSATKTFPVVTTANDQFGNPVDSYSYTATDDDWTEVSAGENESVELVLLPGENPAPHTFAVPTLTIVPAG